MLRTDVQVVRAKAPLSCMVGYASVLRSLTKGQASFTMELDEYSGLSAVESEKLVESHGGLIPHHIV